MAEDVKRADRDKNERRDSYSVSGEKVIDTWATIVDNGAGREEWILDTVEQMVKDANMPHVGFAQMEVKLGMFGRKRPFLLVMHNNLKDYRMFVGARDFGIHLDVSWFLTFEPGMIKGLLMRGANPLSLSMRIDIFDQQDLSAYTFVVHHCVVRAVKMLFEELKQDPTGMNTRSKGFLSVW